MNKYLHHTFEDHLPIAAEQVHWLTRNVMGGKKSSVDSNIRSLEGWLTKKGYDGSQDSCGQGHHKN
jgi:hypothetical protein